MRLDKKFSARILFWLGIGMLLYGIFPFVKYLRNLIEHTPITAYGMGFFTAHALFVLLGLTLVFFSIRKYGFFEESLGSPNSSSYKKGSDGERHP